MDDAVAVALEGGAVGMLGLRDEAAGGIPRTRRPGSEPLALFLLVALARAKAKFAHESDPSSYSAF